MVKKLGSQKSINTPPPKPLTITRKQKALLKGRPIAEQQISLKKVQRLVEKGLFYHQHRVTLIDLNIKQYQSDPTQEVYEYIGKKEEGKIKLKSLITTLSLNQNKNVKQLKSMIETALTLKNVAIRQVWQEIYFRLTLQILKTSVSEVNSKSKMMTWGQGFNQKMQQPSFLKLLEAARVHFPKERSVQNLIVQESYCMLARYFHFQVNICQKFEDQPQHKDNQKPESKMEQEVEKEENQEESNQQCSQS